MPAVLAFAATVALVASVLIVASSMNRSSLDGSQVATRVVNFISSEHQVCSGFEQHFQRKFSARSIEDATAQSADYLGMVPYVLSLDPASWEKASLRFVGFGPCDIPGTSRSGHMLFQSTEDESRVVSLFVHPDNGEIDFPSKKCCYVSGDLGTDDGSIVVWRRDGVVYYLYTPDEQGMVAAREMLATPENERELL